MLARLPHSPHPITALVPGIPATAPQGGTFPSRFLEEGTEAPRSSTTCTRGHPVEGQPGLGAPTPLRQTEAQGGPPGWVGALLVPLAFELLHDLQETIVSGRVAAEADLHLVQVGEGVLHLRGGGRVQVGRGRRRRGRERQSLAGGARAEHPRGGGEESGVRGRAKGRPKSGRGPVGGVGLPGLDEGGLPGRAGPPLTCTGSFSWPAEPERPQRAPLSPRPAGPPPPPPACAMLEVGAAARPAPARGPAAHVLAPPWGRGLVTPGKAGLLEGSP